MLRRAEAEQSGRQRERQLEEEQYRSRPNVKSKRAAGEATTTSQRNFFT